MTAGADLDNRVHTRVGTRAQQLTVVVAGNIDVTARVIPTAINNAVSTSSTTAGQGPSTALAVEAAQCAWGAAVGIA